MNILFITQLFPYSKEESNTSGALREIIEEWGKMGHHIKVIRPHFKYEKEKFPINPKLFINSNIEVEYVKPTRIPLMKFSYYNLNKIKKSLIFKPDVVICHMYNSYFTFHKLAKKLKVPLIIGIHMSDIRISHNWFHRIHQKYIFKKASAFACRSSTYERLFSQQFPEFKHKTFVAVSGLPKAYLEKTPSTKEHKHFNIITVSSLIKRKQIDKVILALSQLPKEINWEYKIVGTGEEEKYLKHIADSKGVTSNIKFCGQYSRDRVIDELYKNDIFVLPSYNETLGLVYLEAMASGCITLGSKNEGIDGIIVDGENGFLCNPYDWQSLFKKLMKVLLLKEEEKIRIIHNAKATVSLYSNETKAKEYLDNVIYFTSY